jgi:hypothetical protein
LVLGARVLAEFGDASSRYADAKARKNYAGTAPITRQSGNAALRQVGNRLVGILHGCLKTTSPYNETTARAHRSQHAAA